MGIGPKTIRSCHFSNGVGFLGRRKIKGLGNVPNASIPRFPVVSRGGKGAGRGVSSGGYTYMYSRFFYPRLERATDSCA